MVGTKWQSEGLGKIDRKKVMGLLPYIIPPLPDPFHSNTVLIVQFKTFKPLLLFWVGSTLYQVITKLTVYVCFIIWGVRMKGIQKKKMYILEILSYMYPVYVIRKENSGSSFFMPGLCSCAS
jgi:hypothetical protein